MQTSSMPCHSNVDHSTPFSSVKEAVALFGERFLTPEAYSPNSSFFFTKQQTSHPSPTYSHTSKHALEQTIEKLQSELMETKEEVKLLKQKESENELALASLNAELHNNMSNTAQAADTDLIGKMKTSLTLAQILSFTRDEKEELFGGEIRKIEGKKKPVIPLVGDVFSRKKKQQLVL